MITRRFLSIRPQADLVQQALAADGAIACFSSNLFPLSLNADRAPQLKAIVRRLYPKNPRKRWLVNQPSASNSLRS
jgi:hypothetical protein